MPATPSPPAAGGERFVPIILAAGRGSRIGMPKALLKVGGVPALTRCLATCAAAAATAPLAPPIVVAGHGLERVRELAGTAGDVRLVVNPAPDRGQTSSVKAGLGALPAQAAGVLILPVDHPLVEPGDIVALCEAALADPESWVVLPSYRRRAGHPVLVRRPLVEQIAQLGDDQPLRGLLAEHRQRTRFVDRPHEGVRLDIDTPADLERAEALLAGRIKIAGETTDT
jgi:CTP:molybdopterin cytidylyltransferase MocA